MCDVYKLVQRERNRLPEEMGQGTSSGTELTELGTFLDHAQLHVGTSPSRGTHPLVKQIKGRSYQRLA